MNDTRVSIVSDWKLYIDVIDDGAEYGFIDEVLGLYRKHSNNVTNNAFPAIEDTVRCLNLIADEYPGYEKELKFAFSYVYCYGMGLQNKRLVIKKWPEVFYQSN